jgi:hypothetical protein
MTPRRPEMSSRELFADTVGPVDEPVPPGEDVSGRPRGEAEKMSMPVVLIRLLGAGLIAGAILGAAALLKPPTVAERCKTLTDELGNTNVYTACLYKSLEQGGR